jgi:hypothetical protein
MKIQMMVSNSSYILFLFLADEDIYDLDAQNYLSWEKCKHEIDLNHPRKLQKNEDGSTTYSNWPLCGTKTGSLGCKAKNRESDLV